ncbi:phage protein Gp36 family protein [Alienimonas sp. DA493]|uniref:phage protein Gp36 family protein n=1 Tax=Alienimonas sp. DA493 TaxID=3373605 RepID=UPI003754EBE5
MSGFALNYAPGYAVAEDLTLPTLPSSVYVDQAIPLSASGGTAPYVYTVDGTVVTSPWTPAAAGSYVLRAADAAGAETDPQTVTVYAYLPSDGTPVYAARSDVQKRLSASGYKWISDRDRSGTVSEDELAEVIDPALGYASSRIDYYVSHLATPEVAREAGSGLLRDLATDIAAYRVVTQGGRGGYDQLKDPHDEALAFLRVLHDEEKPIPGLPDAVNPIGPEDARPRSRGVQTLNMHPALPRRHGGRR